METWQAGLAVVGVVVAWFVKEWLDQWLFNKYRNERKQRSQ